MCDADNEERKLGQRMRKLNNNDLSVYQYVIRYMKRNPILRKYSCIWSRNENTEYICLIRNAAWFW